MFVLGLVELVLLVCFPRVPDCQQCDYFFFSFYQMSDYPVILSLENHCSVEQQKIIAQHLISILGSALVTKPLGDQMPTCLPSPEVSDCKILMFSNPLSHVKQAYSAARLCKGYPGFLWGLEKYGKKKAEYGKIFVSRLLPLFSFLIIEN